jgi:polygalacturonase
MRKSLACLVLSAGLAGASAAPAAGLFNVRDFGAAGDGHTLDTGAINRAIEAAHAAGGGTVVFPAGTYASYSIHLMSRVALDLGPGATILAAPPPPAGQPGGYDAPEPNPGNDRYEDFGHSHWHNALIWGVGLEDIAITGPGRIYGLGLSRGFGRMDRPPGAPPPRVPHHFPHPHNATGELPYPNKYDTLPSGVGDKAISLKDCRNVILRDFTIYHGGHFGILATGVDNFTIDDLKIDTNRDGMDIDCCQNGRIVNCAVNSPNDDGICLKSSYALGYDRPCENLAISNCAVSGFAEGTMLDGTRRPLPRGGTGRIKFGTESNGGFINIAISNCTFDSCQGLALESVDGARLENVTVTNLAMQNIVNAPIFIRLGARLRGPEATTRVGTVRRVTISDVVAHNVGYLNGILIVGLPDHPIEDLTLSHIFIDYRGGGTAREAKRIVPEDPKMYPEPGRFGVIPSYGMFARHVVGLTVDHLQLSYAKADERPAVTLSDVKDADIDRLVAEHAPGAAVFVLKDVDGFTVRDTPGVKDMRCEKPVAGAKL